MIHNKPDLGTFVWLDMSYSSPLLCYKLPGWSSCTFLLGLGFAKGTYVGQMFSIWHQLTVSHSGPYIVLRCNLGYVSMKAKQQTSKKCCYGGFFFFFKRWRGKKDVQEGKRRVKCFGVSESHWQAINLTVKKNSRDSPPPCKMIGQKRDINFHLLFWLLLETCRCCWILAGNPYDQDGSSSQWQSHDLSLLQFQVSSGQLKSTSYFCPIKWPFMHTAFPNSSLSGFPSTKPKNLVCSQFPS